MVELAKRQLFHDVQPEAKNSTLVLCPVSSEVTTGETEISSQVAGGGCLLGEDALCLLREGSIHSLN